MLKTAQSMTDNINENVNRRTVLKSVTAAGLATTAVPGSVGASEATVRVVETGIYYDFGGDEDVSVSKLDSRPRYTVDHRRGDLVFGDDVSQTRVAKTTRKGALINEQPVDREQAAAARDSQRTVRTAPIGLSTRMRANKGVSLASGHDLPQVIVQRKGSNPKLVIPREGTFDLEPETDREIRLPTETLEVETVRVVEEAVPVEGRPKHRWGPKREYGSRTVDATPVVHVVDHGEIGVRQEPMA